MARPLHLSSESLVEMGVDDVDKQLAFDLVDEHEVGAQQFELASPVPPRAGLTNHGFRSFAKHRRLLNDFETYRGLASAPVAG